MNQILTFDADNMYAVCQTGVITGDLQREAAKHGLLYAGDPSSADSSMIGGNVANNAGGNKAVKYGTTRNQIYSLKVVTPDGRYPRCRCPLKEMLYRSLFGTALCRF